MKRRIVLVILLISALAALIFAFGGCHSRHSMRPGTGEDQQMPEEDGNGEVGGSEGDISDPTTVTITYIFTIDTFAEEERVIERGGQAPYIPVSDTENYIFQYWATDDGTEWDFSAPVTQDLRLYTEYRERDIFHVAFYASSESDYPIRETVREGDLVEGPPVYVPEGHFLEGWYKDSSYSQKYDLSTPITQDLTLYAKVSPLPITISFAYEGEDLAPIHTYYGETVTLPDIKPVEGKCFRGYNIVGYSDDIFVFNYDLSFTVRFLADTVIEPAFVPAWSFEPINGGTEYRIDHYELMNTHFYPQTETVTLPSSYEGKPVTEIAPGAFSNDNYIRKLIIPGCYRSVARSSFSSCYGLEELILEEGVQTIEFDAFGFCTELKSVTLPQSLTSIGSSAFYRTGLTEVSLPTGLETIGSGAFSECSAVIRANRAAPAAGWVEGWNGTCAVLYEGETILSQGTAAYKIGTNGEAALAFVSDTSLTALEIPEEVNDGVTVYTVTGIADHALQNMENLRTLILPDTLEWLGKKSLPNSSSLQYTEKDGMSFLGSRANPYLVLRSISYLQYNVTVPAQTRIVYHGASSSLYSLQFEENSSLSQIGERAFTFYWSEPFDILLPEVKYLESDAFLGGILRIFYEGEGEHWAPDWDNNANAFDLTKGEKYTDETGDWFLQDGKAFLLRLTENTQEGIFLPSTVTAEGETFRVTDVLCGAFYERELPFLYIPDSVIYLNGQNTEDSFSYVLLQTDSIPETWESFYIHPNYLYCGIDGDTLLADDGTLFICANGTARALCRYESAGRTYILPRSVQGIPVDGVLAGFMQSVQYLHVGLSDNILFVEKPNNAYGTVLYIQAEEPPAGWEEGWNLSNSGTPLTVFSGVTFPREIRAEFTFVTDGTAVTPMLEYFLSAAPESTQGGKYFWGWYEDEEFTGAPVAFPYFGTATTLYARFETQRMQDGKSYETAFELEEGVSSEIAIGAGERVFLRFETLEQGKKYTVKSTGNADTYGELYRYSSTLISSADGGGAGENFSLSFTKNYGTYYLVVKLTDKTASATVGIIWFSS